MTDISIPAAAAGHTVLICPDCGSHYLRRVRRHGLLQKKLYPLFGYFPWECAICRQTKMMRVRGKRARRESRAE